MTNFKIDYTIENMTLQEKLNLLDDKSLEKNDLLYEILSDLEDFELSLRLVGESPSFDLKHDRKLTSFELEKQIFKQRPSNGS